MFYFSGIDGLFTDFPDTAVLYRGMIGTEEFGEH
jgi:hypothetical protein